MHIHYITNTRNGLKIGERNQALGVVDALRVHYKGAILLEHDVSGAARLREILSHYTNKLHIIIGVSESGIEAFSSLFPTNDHITVLLGHEVPDNLQMVADKVNILAIPRYVTDCPSYIEGVTIIRTNGVANTMSTEKVAAAYASWRERFPVESNRPVLVALLGGMVDGKDYLPGEVVKIAEHIIGKAKQMGAYVLCSNSPRTSRQNMQDFMDMLSGSGCESAFFPFDVKHQNHETPYRALLGMVAANPVNVIVATGDSVSMPCEIASVVPPEQIYLYPVSSQNRQNNEFVDWMVRSGRAGVVEPDSRMEKRALRAEVQPTMDASGQVADAVLELVKKWINV